LAFNHLVVTGLITVAAALSYGELAGMMPRQAVNLFTFSVHGRLVSFYGWTVLPLFRLELLLQLQLRLQTILRYSFRY
jgi:hypothetical protein